jgi:hypothetical protein
MVGRTAAMLVESLAAKLAAEMVENLVELKAA